jgi:carboxymethylenebutenolidase
MNAIVTPSDGLVAGSVEMTVPEGTMRAYRAMPARGGPFPTVLVVQEIFGLHAWIEDVCRRIAHAGYYAIAPDLYVRQGDATKYTDNQALIRDVVSKVADAQVMGDLDAAVAFARASGSADTAKLGVTGFCWGGRIVWMYAGHNPGVKAAVAWYGPVARAYHAGDPTAIEIVPKIRGAVLGLYGGDDPGIPNETTTKIGDAMKAAGKVSEIVVYPETPHGFFADYRPSYRKDAADDGWRRVKDWFAKHLR